MNEKESFDPLEQQLKGMKLPDEAAPQEFKKTLRRQLLRSGTTPTRNFLQRLGPAAGTLLLVVGVVGLFWFFNTMFRPAGLEIGPPAESGWPSEAHFARWGSEEEPLTDLAQVGDLVDQIHVELTADLSEAAGWVQLVDRITVPQELRSDGLDLFSDETMIHEQWYLLDEFGRVDEAVMQFIDQAGVPRQQSIIANGTALNLTLNQQTVVGEDLVLSLPIEVTREGLALAQLYERPVAAMLVEQNRTWVWKLTILDNYAETAPLDQLRPGRYAKGERVTFLFSWPGLQPLSRQVDLHLDDGSSLMAEVTEHERLTTNDNPPPAVLDLLRQGKRMLEREIGD
ncbi:MAG: hypothetical protein QNJ45_06855 [Ardenticatenaceae bacterium]|nr:hypothetical protein [Ardenticatenaceae bacterium]